MSPRIHPRHDYETRAKLDLKEVVIQWFERWPDITYLEAIRILCEELQDCIRYALRQERHPDDPEKKADEE